MKNFILFFIFVLGAGYYFIPYETKVYLIDMVGLDSSFLNEEKSKGIIEKGTPVSLKFNSENIINFKGNIINGKTMDLSWASLPLIKCFYPKNYTSFDGNVNLHRFILTKNKNVSVKLIQDNPDDQLSMYVYKTDALSKVFPPEKTSVYDCKKNIDSSLEKIIEMNGNTAPSDIVIGVSGVNGSLKGGYHLEVTYK